jgi:hypothetical protein
MGNVEIEVHPIDALELQGDVLVEQLGEAACYAHVGSGRPRPFEAIYRIAVKYWMRHRRVPKLYWSPLFATTCPPLSERSERFGGEARVQLSRAGPVRYLAQLLESAICRGRARASTTRTRAWGGTFYTKRQLYSLHRCHHQRATRLVGLRRKPELDDGLTTRSGLAIPISSAHAGQDIPCRSKPGNQGR